MPDSLVDLEGRRVGIWNSLRSPLPILMLSMLSAVVVPAATPQYSSLVVEAQDVAWDATRSRLFVTVGVNDTQWPSSIVMVNPDTAQVEDSIPIADPPDHIAISDDGQYVFVGIDAKGVVRRYHLPSHTPDFDIPLGPAGLAGSPIVPMAIMVLPGKPQSIVVGRRYNYTEADFVVYDGATPRTQTAESPGLGGMSPTMSVYARGSDTAIYGYDGQRIFWLAVSASGLSVTRSAYAFPGSRRQRRLERRFGG